MLLSLLLAAPAWASLATEPPPGAHHVALLVCEDVDLCAEEMWVVEALEEFRDTPLLLVDAILQRQDGTWDGGEKLTGLFSTALEAAKTAYAEQKWAVAEAALDDAEDALHRWQGSPENQAIFELHFMRGAVRQARGPTYGHELSFGQAAAASWNRTVHFPPVAEVSIASYYESLSALISEGVGRVHLDEGLPGTVYALDGVPLGEGPVEVSVFPGEHRVSATQAITGFGWVGQLQVLPRRTATAAARFERVGDVAQVNAELGRAFQSRTLPNPLAVALSEWCARYAVTEVTIVRATPIRARHRESQVDEAAPRCDPLADPDSCVPDDCDLIAHPDGCDFSDCDPSTDPMGCMAPMADWILIEPAVPVVEEDDGLPDGIEGWGEVVDDYRIRTIDYDPRARRFGR